MLPCWAWAAKKPAPIIRCVSQPYQVTQGLQDRQIALWASHGMYYNADEDRWKFQRARVWTTVEDLFTSSFTAPYLVPMLENAGAVVMQPRAYVRPGYQTIYIRWNKKTKQKAQKITLNQGDYTATYEINTNQGIGIWHYLCTLPKGDYTVSGVESMSIDETTLGPSGYPRYMEGARYWVPYTGVPDKAWVTDTMYTDYLNDIVCRGGWVNYMIGKNMGFDMSIAVHTDAGAAMNDSIVGTMAIYTKKTSAALADSILSQVVRDMQRMYNNKWPRRELRCANYSESRTPTIPAMIIEMLSHQNYQGQNH